MIKINITNEIAQLRAVIVGIANAFGDIPTLEECYDPKSKEHVRLGIFPLEKDCISAMDALVKVFKKYNVTVYRPQNIKGLNQIFSRDIAFVIDNKFVFANVVKEREKNGKFKSLIDFIKRANPKDINKLQLEGLVKAGAFDKLNINRQSLFNSIPNLITKSKNIFENKSANQIDLFGENENQENEILSNTEDWKFEERLSKEFEAVGFFISDHPLNQYKEVFNDYNIIDYQSFNTDENLKDSNIAATLLKIQERKTAKGNAYAVLKLTDLNSVFELFIFSDTLQLNREILKEGSSLILTLIKSISDGENRFRRINVQKIASLKDLLNKPIEEVTFNLKSVQELSEISKFLPKLGDTLIKIKLSDEKNNFDFQLKKKRNIDRKTINLIRNKEISAVIN